MLIDRKYGLEREAELFSKHKMGKAAEFDQIAKPAQTSRTPAGVYLNPKLGTVNMTLFVDPSSVQKRSGSLIVKITAELNRPAIVS